MTVAGMEERFLLDYKKCQSIRRLARASAHGYNNIFAALGGQIGMALKAGGGARGAERKKIIDDLLQRGIIQTELLYGFSLERTGERRDLAPRTVGDKTVALLNAVSSQHRFVLTKRTQTGKIYGNSHDLLLTLFYLGENAIEAMPDGGTVQLLLSADKNSAGESCVSFRMLDEGGGFATSLREKAFDPFVTTKEDRPFRGLGLFAASILVHGHGGEILLEESATTGSCICVNLPLSQAGEEAPAKRSAVPFKSKKTAAKQRRRTFLVVDDEESMRSMLGDRLRRQGHRVYAVPSCTEALQLFAQLQDEIDYILLDLWLQDSKGTACAEKLRKISRQARFIFMSGIDSEEDRGAFLSWPFLRKPFSIRDIKEIIENDSSIGT